MPDAPPRHRRVGERADGVRRDGHRPVRDGFPRARDAKPQIPLRLRALPRDQAPVLLPRERSAGGLHALGEGERAAALDRVLVHRDDGAEAVERVRANVALVRVEGGQSERATRVRRLDALALDDAPPVRERGEDEVQDRVVHEVELVEVEDAAVGAREAPGLETRGARFRARLDVHGADAHVLRRGEGNGHERRRAGRAEERRREGVQAAREAQVLARELARGFDVRGGGGGGVGGVERRRRTFREEPLRLVREAFEEARLPLPRARVRVGVGVRPGDDVVVGEEGVRRAREDGLARAAAAVHARPARARVDRGEHERRLDQVVVHHPRHRKRRRGGGRGGGGGGGGGARRRASEAPRGAARRSARGAGWRDRAEHRATAVDVGATRGGRARGGVRDRAIFGKKRLGTSETANCAPSRNCHHRGHKIALSTFITSVHLSPHLLSSA